MMFNHIFTLIIYFEKKLECDGTQNRTFKQLMLYVLKLNASLVYYSPETVTEFVEVGKGRH